MLISLLNGQQTGHFLYGCYLKCEQEIQWECIRCMRLTGREWAPLQHTGGFRGQALIDTFIEKNRNKQNLACAICQPLLDPKSYHHQRRCYNTPCCRIGQNPPRVCRWKEKHWLEEKTHMHGKSDMERMRNKEERGIFLSVMNTAKGRTQRKDHSGV